MTTETILTPAQVDSLLDGVLRASGSQLGNYTFQKTLDDLRSAIRVIEQAVLQSPEVQAWKRDAERMEWYFGSADKSPWMPEYMRGCNDGWSVDQWRMSIDAAMEKQK